MLQEITHEPNTFYEYKSSYSISENWNFEVEFYK